MKKIYLIQLYLDRSGLRETILDFEYKETKSRYVVEKISGFGGQTTRLKKSDILKIESKVREDLYYVISFYTWCFENDKNNALSMLHKKTKEVAIKQSEISAILLSKIQAIEFLYT